MMERVRCNTVGSLIRRSARRFPDRQALIFGERSWTYAQLDQASDQVARNLLAWGLRSGDRVAAVGKNSDAYLILWLAVAKAGLVHVPVNYALTGEELRYILTQSGARSVFADPALTASVTDVLPPGVDMGTIHGGSDPRRDVLAWAAVSGPAEGQGVDEAFDEEAVVQLLYTSGTTSKPKGAMMTHRALIYEYMSAVADLDLKASDRPLHALPLYHSAQMHVFIMPYLMLGATNWLLEAPAPSVVLETVERERISSFFAPPTVWISLLRHEGFDEQTLTSLIRIYYGASIMPAPIVEELARRLPQAGLYNCFGQSEIAPLACVLRPEEHAARPSSAGRPVLFVEMQVVNDALEPVKPGEVGEVVYRSPQLCLGYWDKPEETQEAFVGGWFHSGDLARIDSDGYIEVVDRKKDIINTGGVVVASREVEEALYRHPGVHEVAVIATPDPRWIEAVTAVVVPKPGWSGSAEELIRHARNFLAPFKVPKRVEFVDELPKNASGKILKRVLRDRFAGNPPSSR